MKLVQNNIGLQKWKNTWECFHNTNRSTKKFNTTHFSPVEDSFYYILG